MCVCMYIYVCTYVCIYVNMYIYAYICVYVWNYVFIYVCMGVRTFVCMQASIYVFLYIIKYAPSPGSDTTYYNVSSYPYLFMGRGCRVWASDTAFPLQCLSFDWYFLALVVYAFTAIVCHSLLSS